MSDVVIAGGADPVGRRLLERHAAAGRSVVTIGDHVGADVRWDDPDGVRRAVDGASLLVTLGGRSQTARFTEEHRDEIIRSRVQAIRRLRDAIRQVQRPPRTWIAASSARIYASADERPRTEADRIEPTNFTADVASHIEHALFQVELPVTRRIALRTAVVIGDTSATRALFRLARSGLGGTLHDGWWPAHSRYRSLDTAVGTMAAKAPSRGARTRGRQKFSWVHVDDVVRAIEFLEHRSGVAGPVNVAAPIAVANTELMRTLRRVVRAPIGVPLPRLALEPLTAALGIESEFVLASRWVAPTLLLAHGFEFIHPMLEPALRDAWSARGR